MKLKTYQPPQTLETSQGSEMFAQRAINITNSDDRAYLDGTVSFGKAASEQSWVNYNRIGEVRYAIARSARIAGYAQFVGQQVSVTGEVESTAEAGVVADIVAEMYGKFGGTRGLIERYYTLMKITGEGYPIWVNEGDVRDGLWMLGPHEIADESFTSEGRTRRNEPVTWITGRFRNDDATGVFRRTVAADDFIGRIWVPSPMYTDETDSPMNALNGICEMLYTLTESIMGRLRQRFALAGLLLIPNEISDAAIPGTAPQGPQYSNDKVLNYLIHIMTTNVVMHDQGKAQIPALLKGPADALEKIRHLILDTMVAETDIRLRAELINRLLDGLDQQKQGVTGGEDTNHWGMWAVSDEERRITVQPDLERFGFFLTKLVLWPALKARNWEAARIRRWRVGYDISRASVKTNQAEDARQARDLGAVNLEFVRQSIGATDDDAMGNDEYVRWIGEKMNDPVLATYGLAGIEVADLPVRASNQTPGPNPDSETEPSSVGPGVGDPGSPNDRDSDAPKSEEPG